MNEHLVKLLRRVEVALEQKALDEKTRLTLWADVRTELAIADRMAGATAEPRPLKAVNHG
jgi:hypothetical protein